MTRPTGLRLLVPHWLLDVDAGTTTGVGVTGWLTVPGREPLLVEEIRGPDEFGPVRVGTRTEPRLPGAPQVVRLTASTLATVAASRDGAGVWAAEYRDRARCLLREVDLTGADRRPPRPVTCGTRPIAETAEGLWASVGPDAFVAATTEAHFDTVLLDPATLTERARFPQAELVDDHRVVVYPDPRRGPLELHDRRAGRVTPLDLPTSQGYPSPWPVSPDGRYLPVSFETPEQRQQIMDLWVLDLSTMAWLHVPSMPAYTALKLTSLDWAPDGRLVLLGEFYESGPLLVTWRPGDPVLAMLPSERPATPPDQPHTDAFRVWPAT